jgi:molecular chaperone GrpE
MAKSTANQLRPEDIDHELPAADEGDESRSEAAANDAAPSLAAVVSEQELKRVQDERDALFDRLARLQAEFENFRKRNQREQQEFREYAVADAVKALLPALDSLDLALKNAQAEKSELHSGVELTQKQLHDALKKLGVREIEAEGQTFDPQLHQAVEMVDTTEVPDHQIIEELQRGYKIKDRLLRPAMVRVARNPNP